MAFVIPEDLAPFATIEVAKAEQMIADATAMAVLAAPCLADEGGLTEHQLAAVKAILRAAILRWNDAGSGALQSESVGPYAYAVDSRQQRRSMFWPSEIEQLQGICGGDDQSGIFSIDTVSTTVTHAEICSINFGALYCSCGASLTLGLPLYEWP